MGSCNHVDYVVRLLDVDRLQAQTKQSDEATRNAVASYVAHSIVNSKVRVDYISLNAVPLTRL
jgi:hypothetical protein